MRFGLVVFVDFVCVCVCVDALWDSSPNLLQQPYVNKFHVNNNFHVNNIFYLKQYLGAVGLIAQLAPTARRYHGASQEGLGGRRGKRVRSYGHGG